MIKIATPKKIILNDLARSEIIKGIDILANAVKVTLGPGGRNVAIKRKGQMPRLTKDGVTVARAIELKDELQNAGAQLVRSAAHKTAELAGDGTTTATVLTQVITREGNKAIVAGYRPSDIQSGMQLAVNIIIEELKRESRPIKTKEEIIQIGTISSNGDRDIGEKIASAMEIVGTDGIITFEQTSQHSDLKLEVTQGLKIEDRGYISSSFINNLEKATAEFQDACIFIVDAKLNLLTDNMKAILEDLYKKAIPLLIIAEDIEGEFLQICQFNKLNAKMAVCPTRAPSHGSYRTSLLEDIARLTGGTVISERQGISLSNLTPNVFGKAKKVVVERNSCLIVGGEGDPEELNHYCNDLKRQIIEIEANENIHNKLFEKTFLQKRLASLTGGIAVLKVGGATDIEASEKKDRVEDALHATRAATEEGIVAGGGVALKIAAKSLKTMDKSSLNEAQRLGINIIANAASAPLKQIISNTGEDPASIIAKLESQPSAVGYDAQNMEFVNMFDQGIIDPLKVVRCALTDAVSISSLIINTEALIIDEDSDNNQNQNLLQNILETKMN